MSTSFDNAAVEIGAGDRMTSADMTSVDMTSADTTDSKNLLLLVQLRWIAVAGQVVTILVVHSGLGVPLPLAPMGGVIAFLVALNLLCLWRRRGQEAASNGELLVELLLDVGALTIQLHLSGGATNPFVSLFILQVILGAVLLEAWSAWVLVAVTGCCFVLLTAAYRPIELPHAHDGGTALFSLHIQGMFLSFLLAAGLLVFFVTRIQRNLRARDAHLAGLRQRIAEEEHVVRLGLLASGAAHELGTPLGTVSVILGDWRRMPAIRADAELLQDVAEMQAQVERCKRILSGILMSSGETRGEGAAPTTVHRFLDGLVAQWRAARMPQGLEYANRFGPDLAIVSDTAVRQAIVNVLDNAAEASPGEVRVVVERIAGDLNVTVADAGPGFDPAMLGALGKPYRSTKGRPGGGLGLFLVVNVLRKLGGAIRAENRPEGGALVTLTLPLAALSPLAEDGGLALGDADE